MTRDWNAEALMQGRESKQTQNKRNKSKHNLRQVKYGK